MSDDAHLLRRYADDRSEEAFAELVRRHLDLVYSAALRRTGGDVHRAKDVSQQVFSVLAQRARSLSRHTVLAGWLYTTTRNAALNAMRTEQRRQSREREALIMQDVFSSAEGRADWEQLRPVLDQAMDELSDEDREAVLLRFFQARPFAEVGAALGLKEETARVRVHRALEKLRTLLARRGITSTAAALTTVLAAHTAVAAPAGLAATVTGAALAGAAAVGGGTTAILSFFQSMSTPKIIAGIASAVAILTAGTTAYETHRTRSAEAELVATNTDRDALRTQLQALEQRVQNSEARAQSSEQRSSELQKTMESLRTNSGAARAAQGNGTASRSSGTATDASVIAAKAGAVVEIEMKSRLLTDPALQNLNAKQFQTALGLRYGPLYKTLGLTPDQIARFESVLTEKYVANADLSAARLTQRLSDSDPAVVAIRAETIAPLDDALRGVLGDAAFQRYQSYEKAAPIRSLVDSLATNTYYTDTPLTGRQAEQLTQLLAATGTTRFADMPWEALTPQLESMLSAPQLAVIKSMRDQAQLRQQIELQTKHLVESAQGPGEALTINVTDEKVVLTKAVGG